MKPLFILLVVAASAMAQQQVTEAPEKSSAADITRGRTGGDGSQTSTSIRIEGNANQGAGVNTQAGENSNKTLRIEPSAAAGEANVSGTSTIAVTGASSGQPVTQTNGASGKEPGTETVQPVKTSGSTTPEAGATDTGPGAER